MSFTPPVKGPPAVQSMTTFDPILECGLKYEEKPPPNVAGEGILWPGLGPLSNAEKCGF